MIDLRRPVSLIGPPGSGKSTVAKKVGKRLGLPSLDTDRAIEERLGRTIASFFATDGEAAFRELESSVLEELVAGPPVVLATGGGIVLSARNRTVLHARTRCVYLRTPESLLWQRLRRDRRRPLLQVADPQARLHQLLAERAPLYEETAHDIIETGRMSFEAVVAAVADCAMTPNA